MATLIRWLRLQAIRRDILAEDDRPSLAALAQRWGMANDRTFRRAFAREFGCPPSALRNDAKDAALPEPAAADLHRSLLGL